MQVDLVVDYPTVDSHRDLHCAAPPYEATGRKWRGLCTMHSFCCACRFFCPTGTFVSALEKSSMLPMPVFQGLFRLRQVNVSACILASGNKPEDDFVGIAKFWIALRGYLSNPK